ncbi:MAG: DUF4384 domain-containing protein [Lachnoclostridium sp.]|nr:DUF4384 domain-containing protein [Lachnoclostridium sp.]
MRKFLTLILLLLTPILWARETKTLNAHYVYAFPENLSQSEAKSIAVERAITEALASEFGSSIKAETWTELRNINGESHSDMWTLGSSFVKGEWIETIGEPRFEFKTDGQMLVVEVWLKGKAAPINSAFVDLDIRTIRVNNRGSYESEKFMSGDTLQLSFSSPIDGNLLIFLADDQGNVFQLLPFPQQKDISFAIKGSETYTLFKNNYIYEEEQYIMMTDKSMEHNLLYVIFSSDKIVKPSTKLFDKIQVISSENFRKWLGKLRNHDDNLQLRVLPITILNSSR